MLRQITAPNQMIPSKPDDDTDQEDLLVHVELQVRKHTA